MDRRLVPPSGRDRRAGSAALAPRASHSISIRHVTKRYDAAIALDDVSLEIARGSFLTLLGPSGSGKTTLLMTIAGFTRPDAGTLHVDDRDITGLEPEKRNFGMVFQGYALFPHLTVARNVAFPLRVRGRGRAEIDERVARALEMVQLGHLAGRYPRQLSGGQQQRVALARALVFEPEVLLLDEPLSALDKTLRADLQWELKDLHRRLGMTFVYVTHDQEEALSMSDEIAIIRDGRIVQKGAPESLYERPATHFVAGFLGKSNFVEGTVAAGADGRPSLATAGGEIAIPDGPHPVGARLVLAIRPEKLAVSLAPPEGAVNRIGGRLLDWTYFGSIIHCRVETALGTFQAQFPAWRSGIALAHDETVWLAFPPEAAVAVTDDR